MYTALLSAYDKSFLVEFAADLHDYGWKLLASGGTAKRIAHAGLPVTDIAVLVGEPILGHRVVTLSRQIHAGLLSRDTPEDNAELERVGMPRIDLVYVNLYPLADAIARPDRTLESVLEMTDIGGPAMIMAAVKGQRFVIVDRDDLPFAGSDARTNAWKDAPRRCVYARKAVQVVTDYYRQLLEPLDEVTKS